MPCSPDSCVGCGKAAQKFRAPCVFSAPGGQRQLRPVLGKETICNATFSFPPVRELCHKLLGCSPGTSQTVFLMANQYKLTTTSLTPLQLLRQLRTQCFSLRQPPRQCLLQTQSNPAWLGFVVLLDMECVVVAQETLFCGPQHTADPDTARGHGVLKTFILSATLVPAGKSYQRQRHS